MTPFPEALREPPRKALGRLETPMVRLRRTSVELGIDLWVKRDDLSGVALSGNKVRKLEYLAAEAEAQGASALVTCGGVNSNHARATAFAAAQLGWGSRLLLRGVNRSPPMGNLLLDRWVGAEVRFTDADGYARRSEQMAAWAGDDGYVIPEGGSNGLGACGYIRAAAELIAQARAEGIPLRRVVHACGSGGTTAGLALGLAALDVDLDLVSVCVMESAEHFHPIVSGVIQDAVDRGIVSPEIARRSRWRMLDGYVGRGYALTTPEELREHRALAQTEGLVIDPVYSGKAFLPIRRGSLPPVTGATVFLHTGGIFELFAYPELVESVAN